MAQQSSDKVRVLVVEDEVIIADHLADTLVDLGYEVGEPCLSYTEAIRCIENGVPDLALLDIHLRGTKTGIDLARQINEEFHFPFIFITSNSDKETLELAKQVAPSAFLVKPYTAEDLFTSIEVALFNFAEKQKMALNQENLIIRDAIFIKKKQTFIRVDLSEIMFIESSHIYLELVLKDGERYTIRSSFAQIISKLHHRFVRTHRSYIVNLDHVQAITPTSLTLGPLEVPISKSYRERIFQAIQTS